jgi:UDP-glucuronate 4-epimerase
MAETALVTGGAGFIGSHLVDDLLMGGWEVDVVDSFDNSYPVSLKRRNVEGSLGTRGYRIFEIDIRDADALDRNLRSHYDAVVHLAGKAGPRQSIAEPELFEDVNVGGTRSILEFCARRSITRVVYASSSSVYGENRDLPWRETAVPMPISPYAETKLSAEDLGRRFSASHGIGFAALRFFTVFGPRQRPGLAMRLFAQRMLRGEPVPVFGDGSARRDFTYVGDLVAGIRAAMSLSSMSFEIFNLGSDRPVTVLDMIRSLELALGLNADIEWCPPDSADLPMSWANITKARRTLGYEPATSFDEGVGAFANWMSSLEPDGVGAGEVMA